VELPLAAGRRNQRPCGLPHERPWRFLFLICCSGRYLCRSAAGRQHRHLLFMGEKPRAALLGLVRGTATLWWAGVGFSVGYIFGPIERVVMDDCCRSSCYPPFPDNFPAVSFTAQFVNTPLWAAPSEAASPTLLRVKHLFSAGACGVGRAELFLDEVARRVVIRKAFGLGAASL